MESASPLQISSAFIWRRVHSLMGFWLVLYLILHLITNSQAALWMGNDGAGFVRMVNALESLPYLHVVEVILIGVPLAIHLVWGIKRTLEARSNVVSLKYERNIAYSLQRLTSWILTVGIIGHVVQMRFLEMPKQVEVNGQEQSMVILNVDDGLYPLALRLGVTLQDSEKPNQVVAVADSPGKAMLLMLRATFKSPLYAVLYTIFLLAAAFHAFNGFWTFLVTWGVILSYRSQKAMIPVCMIGVAVLAFLGLAAIWGSYWK